MWKYTHLQIRSLTKMKKNDIMVLMNTHLRDCPRCADRMINQAEKALGRSETEWAKNFWYGVWQKLMTKYKNKVTLH